MVGKRGVAQRQQQRRRNVQHAVFRVVERVELALRAERHGLEAVEGHGAAVARREGRRAAIADGDSAYGARVERDAPDEPVVANVEGASGEVERETLYRIELGGGADRVEEVADAVSSESRDHTGRSHDSHHEVSAVGHVAEARREVHGERPRRVESRRRARAVSRATYRCVAGKGGDGGLARHGNAADRVAVRGPEAAIAVGGKGQHGRAKDRRRAHAVGRVGAAAGARDGRHAEIR